MDQGTDVTKAWWYMRFRIKWPENSEPSWHIDLMLAHKILAPVLRGQQSCIDFWRFHRRAARDEEGHQLSLACYCTPDAAEQIYNSIKSDPFLKRIKRAGLIIQDIYDDPSKMGTSNIPKQRVLGPQTRENNASKLLLSKS